MKEFIAGKNENNMRISRFVEKTCPTMPKSLLQKSFRNGRIKIKGKKALASYKLAEGDIIHLYINDEFFETDIQKLSRVQKKAKPVAIERIVYEDENIIIVNKPVDTLVHSDITNDDTLLEEVTSYLSNTKQYNSSLENLFHPAACNRLDRGTEGLVIFAKNFIALQEMNLYIKNHEIRKKYLCIAYGNIENGLYKAFIKRDIVTKTVAVNEKHFTGSKEIQTKFTNVKHKGNFCLLDVELITGRTHQIRAHLSSLNCPIIGDMKYGNKLINQKLQKKHQLLIAYKLVFSENFTNSKVLHNLAGKTVETSVSAFRKEFENLSRTTE